MRPWADSTSTVSPFETPDLRSVFGAQIRVIRRLAHEGSAVRRGRVHALDLAHADQLDPLAVRELLGVEDLGGRFEGVDDRRGRQVDLLVRRQHAIGAEEVVAAIFGEEQSVRMLLAHLGEAGRPAFLNIPSKIFSGPGRIRPSGEWQSRA
jgi:hypothetical protein